MPRDPSNQPFDNFPERQPRAVDEGTDARSYLHFVAALPPVANPASCELPGKEAIEAGEIIAILEHGEPAQIQART